MESDIAGAPHPKLDTLMDLSCNAVANVANTINAVLATSSASISRPETFVDKCWSRTCTTIF